MSNFWAQKLGGPTARPASAPTPSTGAWWSQPVYSQRPGRPEPEAPAQPPQSSAARAAIADRHQEDCPSCGGDNYVKPTPATRATCFDCGWPIQHSTSGVAVPNNSSAVVRNSLHQAVGAGYQPGFIAGHV